MEPRRKVNFPIILNSVEFKIKFLSYVLLRLLLRLTKDS